MSGIDSKSAVVAVSAALVTTLVVVVVFLFYLRGMEVLQKRFRTKPTPQWVREFLAEFMGCFILLSFGIGANAQNRFADGSHSEFLTVNIAWGLGGIVMGVYWSAPISGGHLNPAVSLALAIIGRFPWYKVGYYVIAQLLGSFVGTACVFSVYRDVFNHFDGGVRSTLGQNGTAGVFASFPQKDISNWNGLGDQIFATALLVGSVLALTDKRNMAPKSNILPFVIGWLVVCIGTTFGYNCGYPINPARDFAPRLFTLLAGWGAEPFRANRSWFVVPLVGQFVGALVGALMYLFFIELFHPDDSQAVGGKTKPFGKESFLRRFTHMSSPILRESLAEFIGTFVLCAFGVASVAQHVLSKADAGSFLSVNIGWGMAVAFGIYWSGGVSGGHLNPSVSLALAVTRRFPWRKLPFYCLAQFFGAFMASAVVYGVYRDALLAYDSGLRSVTGPNATAGIWATYPMGYVSTWSIFGDQVFSTALLVSCIFALTNKNLVKPTNMMPLIIGFLVVGIGGAFGLNCGYAVNPARDLAPRVFTLIAGWGTETFWYHDYHSLVNVVGQLFGGVLGALLYVVTVELHVPASSTLDEHYSELIPMAHLEKDEIEI